MAPSLQLALPIIIDGRYLLTSAAFSDDSRDTPTSTFLNSQQHASASLQLIITLASLFTAYWRVVGKLSIRVVRHSSPSTLSWIGSLTFAWIAILALVNARVRTTALWNIFTLALGQILRGFGTHHVGVRFQARPLLTLNPLLD